MNTAHPRRSTSAGRTTSLHNEGFMSATSSSTTPSKYRPRNASGLSAPKMRIRDPPPLDGTLMHNSDSFTCRPGMTAE
ncbi:hypothetical protein [uncultured Desulfovibrio sp.]|uniref:hypothetical protein n=1 Tax=uncultured Desulfovibrio sp. TaxID=167968 RepID=UPI00261C8A39|nr:hypothetical protein [uncultured Desulfovibrio sp.]